MQEDDQTLLEVLNGEYVRVADAIKLLAELIGKPREPLERVKKRVENAINYACRTSSKTGHRLIRTYTHGVSPMVKYLAATEIINYG